MSMSNGYDVEFELAGTKLQSAMTSAGVLGWDTSDPSQSGAVLKLFCDEAQLPNTQAATGQIQGRHLGENQINYPYAKFYSDLSLSWMCDVNMTPHKFLTTWMHYIFSGGDDDMPKVTGRGKWTLTSVKNGTSNVPNRAVRLRYPAEYLAQLRITKTEKGPAAANQRSALGYILEDCYPYSIDSVPLSYGTSQITKVTANFYYAKHTVIFGDETKPYKHYPSNKKDNANEPSETVPKLDSGWTKQHYYDNMLVRNWEDSAHNSVSVN